MIEDSVNPSTDTASCENCKAVNSITQKFCSSCSFPLGGTDEEKTKFRLIVSGRKRLLKDATEKMNSARTIIYILAGIVFVTGMIQGLVSDDFATMIINLFISLLYLILAAWCNKNPFGAILTAFIIYITINVINAFFDPATIAQGLIMKMIFIAAFVKGIRSANEAKEYLSELEKLKAIPVGNH